MTRRLVHRGAALLLPAALLAGAGAPALAAPQPTTPIPVLDTMPDARTTATTATFSWTEAADTTYECQIQGPAGPCAGNPLVLTGLTDGTRTFKLIATQTDHKSSNVSWTWEVDTTGPTAPVVTLAGGVVSPTTQQDLSFEFASASADVAGYSCSVDGGDYASCTSPLALTDLTHGTHTVDVKGTDDLGNVGPVGSSSVEVDIEGPAAPEVTDVATQSGFPSVSFSTPDTAVSFTCALDAGEALPCTSPWSQVAELLEGSYVLTVVGYDALGNAGAAGTGSVVVDRTAPGAPTLAEGPNGGGAVSSATSSHTFGSEDGATFLCDPGTTGTFAPCDNPFVQTGLIDGPQTLVVKAVDAAGNEGADTLEIAWTVDTVAPTGTPEQGDVLLDSGTVAATPAFDYALPGDDADEAGFACKLDDAADFGSCELGPLADGAHTLVVALKDAAGNVGAGTLTYIWTLDTTGPADAPHVAGLPLAKGVVGGTPTFDFTPAGDTAGYLCKLDGALDFAACVQPVVTDGPHSLQVVAVDALGNQGTPVTYTWTLDTTGPSSSPNVGGVPLNSGIVNSTPTFVFTPEGDIVSYVCKLDTALVFSACAQPVVTDGPHTLQVKPIDGVGNEGAPVTYTWTLDTAAPVGVVTFPSPLAAPVLVTFGENVTGLAAGTVKLVLDASSAAVTTSLSCRSAAGVAVSCADEAGVRTAVLAHSTLVPGQKYRVVVTSAVNDLAGNAATVPATVFRALRVLQETQAVVKQSWASRSSSAAYGGSFLTARRAGASAAFSYTGTSVTWYTFTGPAMGIARVYCGSTLKATVNNYSSVAKAKVPRTVTCSAASAKNTVRIVVLGTKSRAATGTNVVVDAFKVGTKVTGTPAVVQRWATAASTKASGGRFALADQAGESFQLTFRGTGVTWRSLMGTGMGKAKVYVDGVLKGTFDNYATTSKAVNRSFAVADGVHTIRVVVTGTKRAASTGTRVALDALTVA